jgi:hypothetical protein
MIPTHYGRHIVNRRHFFSGFGVSYSSIYIYIYRVREGEGVRDHRKNWQAPERNGYREFIERYSEQGKGCVCGWCLQNSERNREGFVS